MRKKCKLFRQEQRCSLTWFCLSGMLLLVCLSLILSGCGSLPEKAGEEQEDLSNAFRENEAVNEVGSINFGFGDQMDQMYVYDGEALELPFSITGTAEDIASQAGVMLFVDGVAQPYSAVYGDGTVLQEAYMQVFTLEGGKTDELIMKFHPVAGKKGEMVNVLAATILAPNFLPESEERPGFGIYHSDSATMCRKISMEAEPPASGLAAAEGGYEVSGIAEDILDQLAAWNSLETLDTTARLELLTEEVNVIRAANGKAEVTLRLYGGVEADFNITLFVNHKPVKINGNDFLKVRTEKNKMVTAVIEVDMAELDERNSIYAYAVARGEDYQLEINNPIKSASVLLVE